MIVERSRHMAYVEGSEAWPDAVRGFFSRADARSSSAPTCATTKRPIGSSTPRRRRSGRSDVLVANAGAGRVASYAEVDGASSTSCSR